MIVVVHDSKLGYEEHFWAATDCFWLKNRMYIFSVVFVDLNFGIVELFPMSIDVHQNRRFFLGAAACVVRLSSSLLRSAF